MDFSNIQWTDVLAVLGIVAGVALVLAILVGVWVFTQVRRINVPPDADFFTTLRYTPFSVVILLDLLDLALDFLSAPIAWIILDRLGLKQLRGVSVVESFIPGTQMLPTMTTAWLIAKFIRNPPTIRVPDSLPRMRR